MRSLFTLLLVGVLYINSSAQTASVVFEWQYINVIEGYDHESKMEFFVNDAFVGESSVSRNSVRNSYTLVVDEGTHTFTAQNWALYEGEWEEVLIGNDYSMDAQYVISLQVKSGIQRKVSLIFDIDSQKVITVSVK